MFKLLRQQCDHPGLCVASVGRARLAAPSVRSWTQVGPKHVSVNMCAPSSPFSARPLGPRPTYKPLHFLLSKAL